MSTAPPTPREGADLPTDVPPGRVATAEAGGHAADDETRFAFGKNWQKFRLALTPQQVEIATDSVRDLLEVDSLRDCSALDAGCGSGLFSLAMSRLGAGPIRSFDYDGESVASTAAIRDELADRPDAWTVERGSCLDADYLESLGTFDVVYSWGVLHHTGAMWDAIDLTSRRTKPGGLFALSIYNRQPWSPAWTWVKRTYCRGFWGRTFVLTVLVPPFALLQGIARVAKRLSPLASAGDRDPDRGMRWWRDIVDWFGGFPFEVAKPEEIFLFLRDRGFVLRNLRTVGGRLGCNEFVFERVDAGTGEV